MKADLSRGHRPDEKRGKKYRRVLLQQGRLLLDSDFNALVDAGDTRLRDLARAMACRAGSPDLGFLVTPGPLLALFDTLDAVSADPAPFDAYRDHALMYLDRSPSLYLGATVAAGKATVALRRAVIAAEHAAIRLWLRLAVGVTLHVTVNGAMTPVIGQGVDAFRPHDVPTGAGPVTQISLSFASAGPANEAWIGLVEGHEPAQTSPRFWVAAGRFLLDGLAVEVRADTRFPDVSFPPSAGFIEGPFPAPALASGDKLVAYIEGWERHLTRVEDPGIFEQALGSTTDTCTRTQAIGQVKLARCSVPATDVREAFGRVNGGAGKLTVVAKHSGETLDPCAEIGGYTGGENRLYRFEVHQQGSVGQAVIKWSRNNGSDLFAASVEPGGGTLALRGSPDIRDGDLIELLTETTDLADGSPAEVSGSPASFTPARRAVGPLYFARTIPGAAGRIKLLDVETKAPATVDSRLAAQPIAKVRRWDGLLDTTLWSGSAKATFSLGDGIEVDLTGGAFAPGEYWQYEARKLLDNANGPWLDAPHGPERVAAPLGLFTYQGPNAPLQLERWYDERFPELCSISADDVSYDGQSAGVPSWTVQQALDILLRRETAAAQESVQAVYARPGVSHDQLLTRGAVIPAERLGNGLLLAAPPEVELSGATAADCTVTLEMPYPLGPEDSVAWGGIEVGYQPIILPGTVQTAAHSVIWRPTPAAATWLRSSLPQVIGRPKLDFYASSNDPAPRWTVNAQHHLEHQNATATLVDKGITQGAAAVLQRRAASNEALLRVAWQKPLPQTSAHEAGLIYDWVGPADYSILVYHASAFDFGRSSLGVWKIQGGIAHRLSTISVFSGEGIDGGFQMHVSPSGVEITLPNKPLTWQTTTVRLSLAGQRIGVFTNAPVEVRELSDGVQSLNPETRDRVRARLSLARSGAAFVGPGAGTKLAPFIPDFDTWFWLRVGWPIPYGAGYLGARPYYSYAFREEYPGIGSELIQ